jgi:hypothetical protein
MLSARTTTHRCRPSWMEAGARIADYARSAKASKPKRVGAPSGLTGSLCARWADRVGARDREVVEVDHDLVAAKRIDVVTRSADPAEAIGAWLVLRPEGSFGDQIG